MRIRKIYIKGFQSHEESYVKLDPWLTVVTGPTDSGKTAILRAIRWVCLGEPAGESFVNPEVKHTEVKLELESGYTITKIRSNGQTTYIISSEEGYLQKYHTAKVPEEVAFLTGITTTKFSDFEHTLNFLFQLEAPFLISEAPSTGAKVFGKLANVDDIDKALKTATSNIYGLRIDKQISEKRIEELSEDLKKYEHLEVLENLVNNCEQILNNIDQVNNKLYLLIKLKNELDHSLQQLRILEKKLDILAVVPELEKDLEDIEGSINKYNNLLNLYSNLGKHQLALHNLKNRIQYLIDIEEMADVITNLESKHKEYLKLTEIKSKYNKFTIDYKVLKQKLESYKDFNTQDLEIKYQKYVILKEYFNKYELIYLAKQAYENKLNDTEIRLNNLENKFKKFWETVKVCPISGEEYCPLIK